MIVADTNLIIAFLIESPNTYLATRTRERDPDWRVPSWARIEFISVLLDYLRNGLLMERQANEILSEFDFVVNLEPDLESHGTLELALRRTLSAYDAGFATLARRLSCVCITFDNQFLERAPSLAKHPSVYLSQTRSDL